MAAKDPGLSASEGDLTKIHEEFLRPHPTNFASPKPPSAGPSPLDSDEQSPLMRAIRTGRSAWAPRRLRGLPLAACRSYPDIPVFWMLALAPRPIVPLVVVIGYTLANTAP